MDKYQDAAFFNHAYQQYVKDLKKDTNDDDATTQVSSGYSAAASSQEDRNDETDTDTPAFAKNPSTTSSNDGQYGM